MPRGGKRPRAGRKAIGVRRALSVSLPKEVWAAIGKDAKKMGSEAAVIRSALCEKYNCPNP